MLDKKLEAYAAGEVYPFHMPGHKRMALDNSNPYEIDITEIDGFDNLHHATEILKEAQDKAASIYGAEESFYLINGSTCGILAAIFAATNRHGKILIARNCHKSVYNGICLRQLKTAYVYPRVTSMGLQGQICAEDVEKELQKQSDIEAVLITSPTYDGVVSDIKAIAKVVHNYHIPLIVDGAHGAHFGFSKGFPENPVKLGADVVIESVHKTLPAFTQTALLHLCSNRVDSALIKKYLGVFETSSPSYVLMAGIDRCMDYMQEQGVEQLEKLTQKIKKFHKRTSTLKNIKIVKKSDFGFKEAYDYDYSKILILSKRKEVTGAVLHEILLQKYHLQMEMISGQYVLALCSLMDTQEGFDRLAEALEEIDSSELFQNTTKVNWKSQSIYRKQEQFISIYKADEMEKEECSLESAVGQIAGEYLYLYPPGIPFLVPGEVITEETIRDIQSCQTEGLEVLGLPEKKGIFIVNFS